jgi:hypothetical protein
MIGGLFLLAASLTLVAFAGANLRNCISKGATTAYFHAYSRVENPGAFWVSATCAVFALLLGLALALAAVAGLLRLVS